MIESYIAELIKAVKRKLSKYTLGTYFDYDEDNKTLYIKIYAEGEPVLEETIPISKLTLDDINADKEYIFNKYIMKSSYLNDYITEHDDPNSHLNHLIQWTDDYLDIVNGYYNENYERRNKSMKLHIKEDIDSYNKLFLDESVNLMDADLYDNVALLGYCCTLAYNDLYHIHLCAKGDKFQEIHQDAEVYYGKMSELGDFCLELAKEGGLELYNETHAYEVIKDSGNDWAVEEAASYDFKEAYTAMSNILSDICKFINIIEDMDGVTSDVTSTLDEYLREFTKAVNYFIASKLDEDTDILTGDVDIPVESYNSNHIHESHKVRKNRLFVKELNKDNGKVHVGKKYKNK